MAKEDFCFTYYDGDAARDMAHMNRLERGAYQDIIISQRKFGRLTLLQIKKILGKDFDECWTSIELVLKSDEEKYYIEWLENSINKRKRHSKFQSENGKKGGRPPKINPNESELKPTESKVKANHNPNESELKPLGNGYGNEYINEDDKEGVEEKEETELLLPKMFNHWKRINIDYPSDQNKDYTALNEIAKFICIQKGISYNPTDKQQIQEIEREWELISWFVVKHNFYCKFSLKQVSNHSQTIVKELNTASNGNDNTSYTGRKLSKHEAGLAKALVDLKNDLAARGISGM